MAIQINKTLPLSIGIDINGIYMRMEYNVSVYGNKIVYDVISYPDRDSYIQDKNTPPQDKNTQYIQIENFKNNHVVSYNKDIDGNDVLQLVHNHLYSYITEDELYEKTIIDPSTGEETKEIVVFREKFATTSETNIVDLDPSTG